MFYERIKELRAYSNNKKTVSLTRLTAIFKFYLK